MVNKINPSANLAIVIVNWNGLKFMPACLESLENQTYKNFQVYVTDNGSLDGSVEYIKERLDRRFIIFNQDNKGFAEANNQAIELALRDNDVQYVLCLNNDTILEPDFLEKLIKSAKLSPDDVGSWQGKVVTASEPRILDSIGIEIYPNMNAAQIGVGQIDDGQYYSSEIWGVNAAAGLYSRKLIEAISYNGQFFDNTFFAYLEDVDVAMRARRSGWKAMYVDDAVIRHIGSATSGKDSPFKWQLYSRNRWLLIKKNLSGKEIFSNSLSMLESDIQFAVGFLIKGEIKLFNALLLGRVKGIWASQHLSGQIRKIRTERKSQIAWSVKSPTLISSESGNTTLSVVIPNWNGIEMIGECLDSLRKQTLKGIQVIVVENGSIDGSAGYIRKNYPEVILLELASNRGFAGGVNEGIKSSTGSYIALLNNDAVADPSWALELVNAMEFADIAAAKILHKNDHAKIDSIGDCMSKWGLAYPGGRDQIDENLDASREIFSASGGASIYKRSLLQKIGWFDSMFFAYYEDVDLSFRARLAGAKIILAPKAKVYHEIGGTSKTLSGFTQYHLSKNSMYVFYKDFPLLILIKTLPRFFVVQSILFFAALRQGKISPTLKGYFVFFAALPLVLYKRRKVQRLRSVPNKEIEKWLTDVWPVKTSFIAGLRKFFSTGAV